MIIMTIVPTSTIVTTSHMVVIVFVIVLAMAVAIPTIGSIYDRATNPHFRHIPQ